jgi:hypothetical protein
VVYCSFLPDVSINRDYVARQLQYWKAGVYPSGDQWITVASSTASKTPDSNTLKDAIESEMTNDEDIQKGGVFEILSTPLARQLAGWEPWES